MKINNIYNNSVLTSQETHDVSVIKKRLILVRKIITAYSEKNSKDKYTVWAEYRITFMLKRMACVVASVL
jgi:hypothetical protein